MEGIDIKDNGDGTGSIDLKTGQQYLTWLEGKVMAILEDRDRSLCERNKALSHLATAVEALEEIATHRSEVVSQSTGAVFRHETESSVLAVETLAKIQGKDGAA